MLKELKRTLLGSPIASTQANSEKLSKKRALATFSSDALSSVAYASEEILLVLILAGSAALSAALPISIAIVGLLLIVVISYRQTIHEYPSGGGAYIVAKENLGKTAGLIAAAALLTDYILTVSVSVTSGVENIISAFPSLIPHKILLCMIAIFILVVGNLRGLRESAGVFMLPTYAFIFGILSMIGVGFYKFFTGTFAVAPPTFTAPQYPLTLFLLLRAFSSGCTAMTGVEAVSNGVPAFKDPTSKNAATTLVIMATILGTMFLGITFLAHIHGISIIENETVLSQLARSIFGTTSAYYFIQITTMGILILAANTSFADFPRLSSLLAKDRFLPRQLATLGDRLVFSNGILMLGILSAFLIYVFNASTHALIPLYAVGVFLSFTLSQGGMVRHWFRERTLGWMQHAAVNATGMFITLLVTLIFVVTKFTQGAWIITLILPLFIFMFLKIHSHYLSVGSQLSLVGVDPAQYETPLKHMALVPFSGIHKGVLQALRYAKSLAADVRAVYVEIDPTTTEHIQEEWQRWGHGIPLIVLKSPYRSVIGPLLQYIDEVEANELDAMMTIVIPEFVAAKWWQQLLHNQTALLIRAALTFKRNKVVTSVRYHLG